MNFRKIKTVLVRGGNRPNVLKSRSEKEKRSVESENQKRFSGE